MTTYSKNKKLTHPEVLVSADIKSSKNVTFYNVLAQQGSSFYNRSCQSFFALRDIKMAAREGCHVGKKISYSLSFC